MKNCIIFSLIILFVFISNKSIAQLEQPQECPFMAIHRIVIKNNSVVSFYLLDSLKLKGMKEFWFKSTIDSIENVFNHPNNIKLNKKLYLIYVFFKNGNKCYYYLANYPLLNFDKIFVFDNIFYNGRKEDKTFSMDFWWENINKEEIKILPYKYH